MEGTQSSTSATVPGIPGAGALAAGMADPTLPVARAYARLAQGADRGQRIAATVDLLLEIFDDLYRRINECPGLAQRAFERRDPGASIRISRERLSLYSRSVAGHGPRIRAAYPALAEDLSLWDAVDAILVARIADRYEADIAFSFAHSIRRNICHGLWRPVAYSFPPPSRRRVDSMATVYRRLPVQGEVDPSLIHAVLQVPALSAPWRDLEGDVAAVVARIRARFGQADPAQLPPRALDVIEAGFFRDRLAFLVGRWLMADG